MRLTGLKLGMLALMAASPACAQSGSIMASPPDAFGSRFNAAASKAGFDIRFGAAICEGKGDARVCKFSAPNGITAEATANSRGGVSDIEVQAIKHPAEGEAAGRRRAIEALSTMAVVAWPARGKVWPRILESIVSDAASSGVRGAHKIDGVELSFRVERSDAFRIFAR